MKYDLCRYRTKPGASPDQIGQVVSFSRGKTTTVGHAKGTAGPIMYVKIRPLSVKTRVIIVAAANSGNGKGNGEAVVGGTTTVRELTITADDQQPILLDASLLCGKVAVLSQVPPYFIKYTRLQNKNSCDFHYR